MFPPPMTTDTCTPRSRTSFIRSAISRTTVGEMLSRPPRSCTASPLSFKTMRLYAGCSVCIRTHNDQQKTSILESIKTRVIRVPETTRDSHKLTDHTMYVCVTFRAFARSLAPLRTTTCAVRAEIPPLSCVVFLPTALGQAITRLHQLQ